MKTLLVSALLLVSSGYALAQQGPASGQGQGQANHGACQEDFQTYCASVEPGQGRARKCMKDNYDKLSEACKAHQAEVKARMKGFREEFQEACAHDVETLCKDIKPGQKRIMKCLKENSDKVSETCKTMLQEKKKSRGGIQ